VRTEPLGLMEPLGPQSAGADGASDAGASGAAPVSTARPALERLVRLTDGGLDRMRRIIEDLGPRDLETTALDVALAQLVAETAERTGWTTDVRVSAPNVTRGSARTVYRIAQGLLTNCERHAGASHVRVTLTAEDGALLLTVADDGVGIPEDADGFGLGAMRVRAAEHGGTLEVVRTNGTVAPDAAAVADGRRERGTVAVLRLPLEHGGSEPEGRRGAGHGPPQRDARSTGVGGA
jgi:signal transduction histidine kinase